MRIYSLKEVVSAARERSPFYREFLGDVPIHDNSDISKLPVLDQKAFWEANHSRNSRLLTGPLENGIVFKSGGTTGNPKFSVFTQEEWHSFTEAFGRGMAQGGITAGDRVANIFYSGELYASFLFIMKSMELSPQRIVHFPISGSASPEFILKTALEFGVNVLAGVPTTLLAIADTIQKDPAKYRDLAIRKIIFGGESMYADQREKIASVLPEVQIRSIGYASVDAGLLGYADSGCGPDEHRCFGRETILEIVHDETGEPITECNQPGRILVTNLTRLLMPIIRYPAGDRGMWLEPEGTPDRKFLILGRSEEAARIGPVSLYFEDVRKFLLEQIPGLIQFQLLITHHQEKDALTIRVAASETPPLPLESAHELARKFGLVRPEYQSAVSRGIVHPLQVEWTETQKLLTNPRTGKLRRVIDQRQGR